MAITRMAVILATSSAAFFACTNASSSTRAVPLTSTVVVGGSPCGIAAAAGSVWVSDLAGDRVVRIDAGARAPLGTFPVGSAPCSLIADPDGIWVSPSQEGSIQVLDPVTGRVTDVVEISQGPSDAKLVLGWDDVWATSTPDGDVVRIDRESRQIEARIYVGSEPRGLIVGGGRVWVAVEGANRVVAIDPSTNRIVRRFRLRSPSAILTATKRFVWVAQLKAERVTKLRSADGVGELSHDLAANPQPGTVVDGEVWSPDHLNEEVLRFSTDGAIERTPVGVHPSALVRVAEHVWVANFGDGTVSLVEVDSS